jgi:hypothetical protein
MKVKDYSSVVQLHNIHVEITDKFTSSISMLVNDESDGGHMCGSLYWATLCCKLDDHNLTLHRTANFKYQKDKGIYG